MSQIIVTDGEGTTHRINATCRVDDPASVVEAHGYDLTEVEWEYNDAEAELASQIENASNLQELKDAINPRSTTSPGASANKGNK